MPACRHAFIQQYKHTSIMTYRYTHTQTCRYASIEPRRHTRVQSYKHTPVCQCEAYRHTGIWSSRHTDRKTCKHTASFHLNLNLHWHKNRGNSKSAIDINPAYFWGRTDKWTGVRAHGRNQCMDHFMLQPANTNSFLLYLGRCPSANALRRSCFPTSNLILITHTRTGRTDHTHVRTGRTDGFFCNLRIPTVICYT